MKNKKLVKISALLQWNAKVLFRHCGRFLGQLCLQLHRKLLLQPNYLSLVVHSWEHWCYILARTPKCGAFILRCFGIGRKVNEREDVSVTNEHARRGTRQTNSERKGRLTVLGM